MKKKETHLTMLAKKKRNRLFFLSFLLTTFGCSLNIKAPLCCKAVMSIRNETDSDFKLYLPNGYIPCRKDEMKKIKSYFFDPQMSQRINSSTLELISIASKAHFVMYRDSIKVKEGLIPSYDSLIVSPNSVISFCIYWKGTKNINKILYNNNNLENLIFIRGKNNNFIGNVPKELIE